MTDAFGMLLVGLYKVEKGTKGRLLRRSMIRYIILSYCIALRSPFIRLATIFSKVEGGGLRYI